VLGTKLPFLESRPTRSIKDFACLSVQEVESQDEMTGAISLHLSKRTFCKEQNLVRWRVMSGEEEKCQCRTWILISNAHLCPPNEPVQGGKRQLSNNIDPNVYLAAVTIRINYYINREGRWAQVLNMSTGSLYERQGYGTILMAGVEDLLRQECIDLVVLYPAQNNRAPQFWTSLGYGEPGHGSWLPEEERVSHQQGGPLLPEMDPYLNATLPRWEKKIGPSQGEHGWEEPKKIFGNSSRRHGGKLRFKPSKLRQLEPKDSRLKGDLLYEAWRRAMRERSEFAITISPTKP